MWQKQVEEEIKKKMLLTGPNGGRMKKDFSAVRYIWPPSFVNDKTGVIMH